MAISAPRPPDEAERLRALYRYHILDTPAEEGFDRILRLAARLTGMPAATIAFVDAERQWFKSRIGVTDLETPRESAFCAHAILQGTVMVVPDTTRDPRFFDHPLVTGPAQVRFFAGAPLCAGGDRKIGALCVVDHQPRTFSIGNQRLLEDLARLVLDQLELRLAGEVARTEIRHRCRAEAELRDRELELGEIQRRARLGHWRWVPSESRLTWSDQLYRMFGLERARFRLTPARALVRIARDDRAQLLEQFDRVQADGESRTVDFQITLPGGEPRYLTTEIQAEVGAGARVTSLLGLCQDITGRKLAEQRVERLAFHDALTGLPNRLLFQDRLVTALAHADRGGRRVGLLQLDLDHFKNVNDTLGHDAGDALLREVAARLVACLRQTDTVARLGGDEFAIVLADLEGPVDASRAAASIVAALARPMAHAGQEIHTGTSVGITIFPDDGAAAAQLLKNADIALYRAKAQGRGRYVFFEPAMRAEAERRRTLENELRRALAANALDVFYQPIVSLADGRLSGFEALLRWHHPTRGLRSAAELIPIAEESGLIVPINEFVVRRVADDLNAWVDAGLAPGCISVNLAAAQLQGGHVPEQIAAVLRDYELGAGQLAVEVTEGALLGRRSDVVADALRRLSGMGVLVALDDFGTGYASLTRLKDFPVDRLKIDCTFVRHMVNDPVDLAIVQSIMDLGHCLGKEIVAEGIETLNQLEILIEQGCDHGQGYLFAMPMARQEVARYLTSPRRDLVNPFRARASA